MSNKRISPGRKIVIGLMSGTSVDGIDSVVVELRGGGQGTKVGQLAFKTYPYPDGYKEFLLRNSNSATARLDDVARLNVLAGQLFAKAAKNIARHAGISMEDINLIGSHGQTIHHLPEQRKMFGARVRATLQIGDPSIIAKLTGVTTVGDFRVGDIAVGGSGAPLVSYMDYLLFRSDSQNRGLLNIGGIANITILPKHCTVDDVVAFDTGPGNMLIDALIKRFYRKEYDRGGKRAYEGEIVAGLISDLIRMPYFNVRPPKSTGRELFSESLVNRIARKYRKANHQDLIATVTEFTALSIFQAYNKFISKRTPLDELLVSGGGVHNNYLMEALSGYFRGVRVKPVEDLGFFSDAKEAVCFAVLANEAIVGNPANIPGATGAKRRTVLGKICYP